MEITALAIIKSFVLPPGSVISGVIIGLFIRYFYRRTGNFIVVLAAVFGTLVSLPAVAGALALLTERYPAISPEKLTDIDAEVVVILAGGKDHNRLEYGGITLAPTSLERVRYGAFVARQLKLPILVSGGVVSGDGPPEAKLMADILASEFGMQARWVETRSRNTYENAKFSIELVDDRPVVLVTHAVHMGRSIAAFERQGVYPVPAPVASFAPSLPLNLTYHDFLPSEKAFSVSRYALYELLGMAWYKLRHST